MGAEERPTLELLPDRITSLAAEASVKRRPWRVDSMNGALLRLLLPCHALNHAGMSGMELFHFQSLLP